MKIAHYPWVARAARASRRLGLALSLLGTAAVAMAQNSLEGVTASLQEGQEILKIELTQALAVAPTGFVLQSPARIALDLPAVGNNTGRTSYEFGLGNLKSMTLVQAGDRMRLVLNLKQAGAYSTRLVGRSLLVILSSSAWVRPAWVSALTESCAFLDRCTTTLRSHLVLVRCSMATT